MGTILEDEEGKNKWFYLFNAIFFRWGIEHIDTGLPGESLFLSLLPYYTIIHNSYKLRLFCVCWNFKNGNERTRFFLILYSLHWERAMRNQKPCLLVLFGLFYYYTLTNAMLFFFSLLWIIEIFAKRNEINKRFFFRTRREQKNKKEEQNLFPFFVLPINLKL